jgi:hypothetical protein
MYRLRFSALRSATPYRRTAILALACAAVLSLASPLRAATSGEQAVLAPVHALFDGMARRDKAMILSAVLPDGNAALLRDGKVHYVRLGEFADHLPKGTEKIEERIGDPKVLIDNDIAVVWAPYEFLIDGKVHHCGTDAINLVRQGDRWLIAGVADNSRTNCKS